MCIRDRRDLAEGLAQPTLDHLGDDLGRLALALGLLGLDLPLLGHDVGRHVAGRKVLPGAMFKPEMVAETTVECRIEPPPSVGSPGLK